MMKKTTVLKLKGMQRSIDQDKGKRVAVIEEI